jgi:endonuclease I
MKTLAVLLLVSAVLTLGPSPGWAQSTVLISEMCDPHLNYATDRFIEIYNAGSEAVDLAGWSLIAVGNGGNIFTWHLSGMIDPGEALVAGDATTLTVFPVNFPDEAWSDNNGLWNGKVGDGAKLLDAAATLIDYAVVTGTAFENQDYVRNYGVIAPSTTYIASQWTATPVELATDGSPGTHSTAPPIPGPSISGIITDPALPLAGDDVYVFADVADSTATVTSVALTWGTTSSSLPNQIVMSHVSGTSYGTVSAIPAQAEGVTIYFRVRAWSDAPATSVSELQSYCLPYDLTIHEIQGEAPASPYDGSTVITRGVVTARYASFFVMQDGVGAWNGVWVQSAATSAVGDSVTVRGRVTESAGLGNAGNTLLVDAIITSDVPGASLPAAVIASTASLSSEQYEGVLVKVESGVCTNPTAGYGEWELNDGSGVGRVDDLGQDFTPTLGTSYDVVGPVSYGSSHFRIEPRDESDIVWAGDDHAPAVAYAAAMSDTTLLVTFSEPVEETSAETVAHYGIGDLDVRRSQWDVHHPDQALLSVSVMSAGNHTLSVTGVEDLYGNATIGATFIFRFINTSVPAGYYNSAQGLTGQELEAALHSIIRNHTVCSYDYAWTAYRITDVKPNGKVWDIYSDIPNGTPPYEYTFGVDEGGVGGQEGEGYTREHSWPKSWFGGEVSPMYSDLFALYPTDSHVNGNRGNFPYGEVGAPEWTSENGSKRGLCSSPGYSGIVFEPIDEFKGDIARTYFYMSTRYYTEDASWPGSPMTDGAELLPWAAEMLLEWHSQDPVSQKEIARNGAVYSLQHNRNPFIDHPEFAVLMFASTDVGDELPTPAFTLNQNAPNPFNPATTISFTLPAAADVKLSVYDVSGRLVAELASGPYAAGPHEVRWDGRDASGHDVGSGVYFYGIEAGSRSSLRKMVVLR